MALETLGELFSGAVRRRRWWLAAALLPLLPLAPLLAFWRSRRRAKPRGKDDGEPNPNVYTLY